MHWPRRTFRKNSRVTRKLPEALFSHVPVSRRFCGGRFAVELVP